MWLLTKLLTSPTEKTRCRENRQIVPSGTIVLKDINVSGFTVPNGFAFCSNVRESG
jgi:hypothetical protein